MTMKQTLDIYELLDGAGVDGKEIKAMFAPFAAQGVEVTVTTVANEEDATRTTDFIRILIPGRNGATSGGTAPTIGLIGRCGAMGARPHRIGLVSDADGVLAALVCALKLSHMKAKGDAIEGDALVTTHLSLDASITPREPVDFMGMPVSSALMNLHEVDPAMDAILSFDTSRGNRIIKQRGYAISPTIKEGYILRVSNDLVSVMETVSGRPAVTFPITMQDITPYDNGLYHFNSIMQPCVATSAPVVGVALIAQAIVAGSDSGASQEIDIAAAARFGVEVAKQFTWGRCAFHSATEFAQMRKMYGPMTILQTMGNPGV
ncbi:DUF1177 domain-containing protein [Verminephrobacter eiseniae]|uniref:DUF1177 domain-containing protein n=1 Tax=Verminephrobacter eiseniae (strain EF01-2) TaxID=391735 RepID=A1WN22_VEREI|nr:DUF1177 domain-containing protein [Verminephrobacter eiseniae]ABM59029.1 protein of unknown function DUF1177 [Verminephrobacter eiseniae EF01-2]MCW5284585.1 DUF1177 domain-containing protein [Verminephrobacter eiseniae]MCW5302291.1 DUF1177 domain-containing protein [Verminephrobacter eiseniae]MCW8179636.1 DUF1177 domain-containing protein [Verminephrobacter eiseniae]MCW8191355.1 DUF1177 domain-containing protein [Verminephrobacter eiseniae]